MSQPAMTEEHIYKVEFERLAKCMVTYATQLVIGPLWLKSG